jgi:hypothetical protein
MFVKRTFFFGDRFFKLMTPSVAKQTLKMAMTV